VFDRETRTARSQTASLNNPCLELDVVLPGETEARKTRLFANHPEWQKDEQFRPMGALGLDLGLYCSPNVILVADGLTRTLYRREGDSATQPIPLDGPTYHDERLDVTFTMRFFEHLGVRSIETEPGKDSYAEARVRFTRAGSEPIEQTFSLGPDSRAGIRLPTAESEIDYIVELSPKRDEPNKRFASILSIVDAAGNVVVSQTVVVNDPLVYGGYYFYQANYDEKDPTYSGIQVVRDPGMWWVYLGKLMMVLGSLGAFYFAGDRGVHASGAGGVAVAEPLLADDGGLSESQPDSPTAIATPSTGEAADV
jgi:hypothetical protein